MSAKYIIRLDDACCTMSRKNWEMIEKGFDALGIRPVVAVIPDNKDPVVGVDLPDPHFWAKVQRWTEKDWTIAMHGYTHVFTPISGKPILPVSGHNEFAGLPYTEQARRLREFLRVFRAQAVNPTVWIAPGHCFDGSTLEALRKETEIKIINDG